MSRFLKRIRGLLGTAVTWAVGWMPFGALWGVFDWAVSTNDNALSFLIVAFAGLFGAMGFCAGAIFSAVLTTVESRRSISELSVGRFAAWGALGGLLMSAGQVLGGVGGTYTSGLAVGAVALLAAGSAAGSLVLARGPREKELPGLEERPAIRSGSPL